jgi:hypothetical protein
MDISSRWRCEDTEGRLAGGRVARVVAVLQQTRRVTKKNLHFQSEFLSLPSPYYSQPC